MPIAPVRNGPGDFSPTGGGVGSPSGGGSAGSAGSAGSGTGGGGGVGSPVAPTLGPSPTRSFSTGMYPVLRGALDRVEYGPPVAIGPRDTVEVSPNASNASNCFYSTSGPDAAKTGPRILLTPTSNPRVVRVRNLNEIGVYSGTVGEGVTIDVQRGG
jgi:hypothetical protein